ncbi:urease accessory protein UreD [Nocardia sp. NPDC052254]|uniref:urease accessory protein UreD n=1 Tax=Nocardia sp. NPDC052254 TaxID=3155681 RepID=UPI0034124734
MRSSRGESASGSVLPGRIALEAVTDARGRTRLRSVRHSYPQRVAAPMYIDDHHRGAAYLCVQSPSGGIFSDDSLETTVTVDTGAHLILATQAATQVFAGPGPGAQHRLTFDVRDGALLEYLPKTVIPQAGSRYFQTTSVSLAGTGTVVAWDAVAAGRIAHGERFAYDRLIAATTVSVDGEITVRDRLDLHPARCGDTNVARLIGADYFATFLVLTRAAAGPAVLTAVRAAVNSMPHLTGGVSALPGGCGVITRLLADRASDLRPARHRLLSTARAAVLGTGHVPPGIL